MNNIVPGTNKNIKLNYSFVNYDNYNYGNYDNIIIALSDDMFFFKTDINISIPILLYIGISEDNVKKVYFELIDYKNFHNDLSVRNAFDLKLQFYFE